VTWVTPFDEVWLKYEDDELRMNGTPQLTGGIWLWCSLKVKTLFTSETSWNV